EIRDAKSYRDPSKPDGRNRRNPHGYDVRGNCIAPTLGGPAGFDRFVRALKERRMGGRVLLEAVLHHSSDSHDRFQDHPEDWDHFSLGDGVDHVGNFFGYGWLPRYRQVLDVIMRVNSTVIDVAMQNDWPLRLDHPDGFDDPFGVQAELARLGLRTYWEKI